MVDSGIRGKVPQERIHHLKSGAQNGDNHCLFCRSKHSVRDVQGTGSLRLARTSGIGQETNLSNFLNGECMFGRFICQNCSYFPVYDKLNISKTRGAYSVSDRATIEGVPADRRSESLVVKSGCEDTCALEGAVN